MRLIASQNFPSPFRIASISKKLIHKPECLISALLSTSLNSWPPHARNPHLLSARQASTSTHNVSIIRHTDGFTYGNSGLPVELERLISPRRDRSHTQWAEVIDSYLPSRLRKWNQAVTLEAPDLKVLQPIETLPQLLARARHESKIDLLSYLGVYQGRWEAVLWLVTTMMGHFAGGEAIEKQSKEPLSLLWLGGGQSLDTLTGDPIHLESPQASSLPIANRLQLDEDDVSEAVMSVGRQALGQIWQSLGTMILQAADRSPEDPSYTIVMINVFRILAHLHRISAFPDTIYNYNPAVDQTVLRRPPTIHLLSRRIMSTLSDVEFNYQWEEQIVKYKEQGYELAQTTVRPKVREFGPELWLDLVLWACIEGGWVAEAAWIVTEMEKRKATRESQWSVISWQQICAKQAPKLDWASILRLQVDRTRLNQVGGIGIATGSDSTVDMGTRTISQEVILAIVDGLLNAVKFRQTDLGNTISNTLRGIAACRGLLERDNESLDVHYLNATILRLIETTAVTASSSPGTLQQLIDVRTATLVKSIDSDISAMRQPVDQDDIAAPLGLLHRALYAFARKENLQGSLGMFRRLQDLVDKKRDCTIESFINILEKSDGESSASKDLLTLGHESNDFLLAPLIPVSVLASFMDIIIDSRFYALGYWLLLNQDIDGGPLNSEFWSSSNLQPALLRFATATADNEILTKVLERLQAPLSEAILHALLPGQIVLGKWESVEQLLNFFRVTPGMTWKACDAMAIARALLKMERNIAKPIDEEHIAKAQGLLRNLTQGEYNSDRDLSQLPDLTEIRLANQIGRILQTLPGSLSNIKTTNLNRISRSQASIAIPSKAFNLLLETVVECYGPRAGQELMSRWCHEPDGTEPESTPELQRPSGATHLLEAGSDAYIERVVTPTRHMIRNILRPILMLRQHSSPSARVNGQGDGSHRNTEALGGSTVQPDHGSMASKLPVDHEMQAILDWGMSMYKKFGMSQKEIGREIPKALRKHQDTQ